MNASPAPVVVVLMGIPGSGKSTLAEALAPRMCARIVSRDAVRAAMFKPCSFTETEKAAAFEAVLAAVAANAELGRSTIVDGMPFSHEGELEAVIRVGRESQARTLPVLCSVAVEEAERRLARAGAAGHPAEDREPQLARAVAERFRPLPGGVLELEATRPVDELVQAVLDRLG